jgi:ssDNA-binding Zn-finger/Zn-ribbon topoisomerase 1
MDKLYIATSSLNFNNILATESISPEIFYGNRNFGYKRFTKVEPNPFSNSIIAYNKIPVFQIEETDFDEYPLIVEISKDLINDDTISNQFENNGVRIFQLQKTIYLHPSKVKFIFFNKKQQNTALIKVEPSIETKLLPVYKKAICLIGNDSISFLWDKSFISKTSDLSDIEVSKQIDSDYKTNKLKGFYYSYLLGIIISSPVKEKTLKEDFILISELILEFFNLKENRSNSYQSIVDKLERLKLSIDNADGIKRVPKEELVKAKYLDESNINEHSKLLDYLKSLKPDRKESVYQQLESRIEVSKNDVIVLIDNLKEYLNKPYSKSILSLKIVRITRYISELKKKDRKKTDPLFLIENLNFNGFKITQLTDSFFENNKADLYRNILNDILDYPIHNIQTFKEEKINLAFRIGAILKEYIPNWRNSKERDYFNSLMDNIENYQPFDLKSHPSKLLQSIALFIQKGEEAEKLIDSLIKNQFSDFRTALGLWGSIFGFSALPKTLTNLLFEKENIQSTRKLYQDAQTKLHNSNSKILLNIESIVKPQIKTKDKETPTKELKTQSVKQFESNKEKKSLVIEQKPIKPQQSNDNPKCPKCGGDMILREGKFGKFYGCTKFSRNKKTSCDGNSPFTTNKSVPKKNVEFNNGDYCTVILELIKEKKECTIKNLNNELKNKIKSYSFNIGQAENYIKSNLMDKVELVKVGKSKGVRHRGNEMKFD